MAGVIFLRGVSGSDCEIAQAGQQAAPHGLGFGGTALASGANKCPAASAALVSGTVGRVRLSVHARCDVSEGCRR
jgi:hypothetical protein